MTRPSAPQATPPQPTRARGGRDPLKVLVAGAGAIGQWLGLRLMQGGHDVTLLARPAHAEAIARDGLRVRGLSEMQGHPACVTEPAGLGPFDAIVLTCKAHQTEALAQSVAPLLRPDGTMATMQNGFGNAEKAARAVGASRVAVCLTSHGVMAEGPGRLVHAGEGPTVVGPMRASRAEAGGEGAARRAFSLLDHAKLAPVWSDDMRSQVWRKALVNHAINPVGALHGCDNGGLLTGPAWSQCLALAEEGYALSRCAGVRLPVEGGSAGLVAVVRDTLERTARNRNSMLRDVEAKRPTEIEQLSGRLVRLARRLGIAAPASDEVYRKVKAIEAGYLGEAASLAMVREEVSWEGEKYPA